MESLGEKVPNLHLQQLAYLREISRSPTWTEASRRLHLSLPALSQSMAELEKRLGSPLFQREGRKRRLSPEGELVVDYASRVLGESASLLAELEGRREGRGGRLRAGMIDAASLYILPPVVEEYRRTHRGVELELAVASTGELLRRLRQFELDLAVVVGPVDAEDLIVEDLAEESLYIYGPPGSRAPDAKSRWALYPRGSRTRDAIDEALTRHGIRPRVLLESGNPQVLRQMVSLGTAWAVLPATVGGNGEPVLKRRGKGALLRRPICLVHRRGGSEDPRVDAFRSLAQRLRWS